MSDIVLKRRECCISSLKSSRSIAQGQSSCCFLHRGRLSFVPHPASGAGRKEGIFPADHCILSQVIIDVSVGINDRTLYEEMLAEFSADPHFSQLRDALCAQDVEAAFFAAHSLKGTSGNLNMTRLYEDIQPLVEELRAGRLERADELLQPVIRDYEAIVAAIHETQ